MPVHLCPDFAGLCVGRNTCMGVSMQELPAVAAPVAMFTAFRGSVGCVYSVLVVGHLVCLCHGLRPVGALLALLLVLHYRPVVHSSPVACCFA
jgi:hypothetical protein